MTIMPFVLIIQLVMSGAVFDLKGITEKISYLTLSKWGLDGICAIANTTDTVYMQYQLSGMETAEPEKKTLPRGKQDAMRAFWQIMAAAVTK